MTNFFRLSDGVLTGSGGNPDLEPYKSSNFNMSAGWYFQPQVDPGGRVLLPRTSATTSCSGLRRSGISTPSQGPGHDLSDPAVRSMRARPASRACRYRLPAELRATASGCWPTIPTSDGNGERWPAICPYNSQVTRSASARSSRAARWQLRATYTWRSEYFTGVDRGDQHVCARTTPPISTSRATYNFTDNVQPDPRPG